MKHDILILMEKLQSLKLWLETAPEYVNKSDIQSDYRDYQRFLEDEITHANQRFYELLLVLKYDSEEKKVFSTFQRIAINQERGSLIEYIDTIKGTYTGEMRMYQVSPQTEVIIQKTLYLIQEIKWKSNNN